MTSLASKFDMMGESFGEKLTAIEQQHIDLEHKLELIKE